MKKFIFGLMVFLNVSNVFAADSAGIISRSLANGDGTFMFIAGSRSMPNCQTVLDSSWAFDAKTPNGKMMMAYILTISAQGKVLHVSASNSCTAGREIPGNVWAD